MKKYTFDELLNYKGESKKSKNIKELDNEIDNLLVIESIFDPQKAQKHRKQIKKEKEQIKRLKESLESEETKKEINDALDKALKELIA